MLGNVRNEDPPLKRHMQIHDQGQICERERLLPVSFLMITLQVFLPMVILVRNRILNGVYFNQPFSTQRMKHTFFTKVAKLTTTHPQLAFSLATPHAFYGPCISHAPDTLSISSSS